MKASLVSKNENEIVIQIKVALEPGMLKTEENIQQSLNLAGSLATKIALSDYDSDGDPIIAMI